jgi:tellurite resistance protein TerC
MITTSSPLVWGIFLTGVVAMLLVDLLVLNRKAHKPTVRESAIQSLVWIGISCGIGAVIWALFGSTLGAQYFTGYVIEKSLSVDNIFVWGLVLSFFAVPDKYRHRVLFWGIFGAILMRFIFIAAGVQLIERFDVLVPILGIVLLYSAVKILRSGDDDYDVEESKAYKFFATHLRVTKKMHEGHFFVRKAQLAGPNDENVKYLWYATPLFLCLLVVEVTDVIFAVDSVPAILAVSNDTFVIFASNVMAILGLRALFFLFESIKDKFRYLGTGVAIVLAYVGVKMLLGSHFGIAGVHLPGYHIPTLLSLGLIAGILGSSVLLSSLIKEGKE